MTTMEMADSDAFDLDVLDMDAFDGDTATMRVIELLDTTDDQRHLEGVNDVRVGKRVPDGAEAALERAVEDHPQRREQHDYEVADRNGSEPVALTHARAS